jgi:hypothetical protein
MQINFLALLAAAVSTLVVGFIWYHPKVFGTAWMKETGLTDERLKSGNMLKIFGLTLIFAFFISFMMQIFVIHQFGAMGMMGGDPALAKPSYEAFMADYGHAYRTFKHGAFHGTFAGLFFGFPLVAIMGLFERKSWKYIFINGGYWVVCFILIGGIVCAWE